MKQFFKLGISVLAIGLCVACSGKKESETGAKVIPVKVMDVAYNASAGDKSYVGTIEESFGISLSFSGMGTVEQVFVSEGQKVSKGQLLASLNATSAQSAYDMAKAQLEQAQDAYDRLVPVHQNGSVSDIKFMEVKTGLQQAQSMVKTMKKNLDDCKLYAPSSGVVATRNIEVGSNVIPGTSALKLIAIDRVMANFTVPENEIASLSLGQNAQIEVTALNNAVYSGKIESKGVVANQLSHSYDVKVGIANSDQKLMPGMVCKLKLVSNNGSDKSSIVVPNLAVQISADGKQYVWLADNDTAKRQFITTGNLTDNGIIVTEGLSVGDKLIVEGYLKIGEGMKISIKN